MEFYLEKLKTESKELFKYALNQPSFWWAVAMNIITSIVCPIIPDEYSVVWVTIVFCDIIFTILGIMDSFIFRSVKLSEEIKKPQSSYVILVSAIIIGIALCILAGSGSVTFLPNTGG